VLVAAHILAKAGGTNAFLNTTKATFADLSKEKVAATDVDAVVVISYNDPNPAAYAKSCSRSSPSGRPPGTVPVSSAGDPPDTDLLIVPGGGDQLTNNPDVLRDLVRRTRPGSSSPVSAQESWCCPQQA
jgi:hypothetical protein